MHQALEMKLGSWTATRHWTELNRKNHLVAAGGAAGEGAAVAGGDGEVGGADHLVRDHAADGRIEHLALPLLAPLHRLHLRWHATPQLRNCNQSQAFQLRCNTSVGSEIVPRKIRHVGCNQLQQLSWPSHKA